MSGSLAHASVFAQEITFGWPFNEYERQAYSVQAHRVLEAVGLKHIPVTTPLQQLSGGYKRRVALAVQLVRRPAVSSTPSATAEVLLSACIQILTLKFSLPVGLLLVLRHARYPLGVLPCFCCWAFGMLSMTTSVFLAQLISTCSMLWLQIFSLSCKTKQAALEHFFADTHQIGAVILVSCSSYKSLVFEMG